MGERIEAATLVGSMKSDFETKLFSHDCLQTHDCEDKILKMIMFCIQRTLLTYSTSGHVDFIADIFDINVFRLYFDRKKYVVSKKLYDVWQQTVSSLGLEPPLYSNLKVS